MLFRRETLDGISRGEVTLAFRRWKRAGAKTGGRIRTAAGVVRIGEVSSCDASALTENDARASGFASLAALHEMLGPEDGNAIYRIELAGIEPDERVTLRATAEPSEAEWSRIRSAFDRWNRAAPGYFAAILKLVCNKPETLAARLAAELGVEKLKFKQDVRKLKELGLTESLEVGYRLSPRGEVVLNWLEHGP